MANSTILRQLILAFKSIIRDADGDTKIQCEESADEDKIRMDIGGNERFILEENGRTIPAQPAFLAYNTAEQSNIATESEVTVVFNSEKFDQNNNFNPATYIFTAPLTGKYTLHTNIVLGQMDVSADYYILVIRTSNGTFESFIDPGVLASDPVYWTLCMSCVADMDANDTAYVFIRQGPGGAVQTDIKAYGAPGYTFFSGCLLA